MAHASRITVFTMGTPKPVQPAMAVAAVSAGTVVSVLVKAYTAFRAKRMPKIMARVLCRFFVTLSLPQRIYSASAPK